MSSKVDILKHTYVPQHVVLSPEEAKTVLEIYHAKQDQLPKIRVSDPVVRAIGAKPGDILKIIRSSETAGASEYYRLVVEE
ncbi:MAG: DNA-directed RNA polymerase subunit H [Conexivisphaerales archaeon]